MQIKNILVPIDHSPCSEQAFAVACEFAGKLDARMYLLTAIGIPTYGISELGLGITAPMIDNLVVDNQRALDKLVGRCPTASEALVRVGDARDAILQTAGEVKADLVVMGTHGRRGVSRALLGSVAEMIVRTSPVPVLTVRCHA